jgi:hypothetical protein
MHSKDSPTHTKDIDFLPQHGFLTYFLKRKRHKDGFDKLKD